MARGGGDPKPGTTGDNDSAADMLGRRGRGPVADEQRYVRVAWQYYVEGYTQEEIAQRMGVTRARINRMLAACRERGIIQIRVNSRLAPCVALEQALAQTYGVDARVTLTPQDAHQVTDVVAMEAAHFVSNRLSDLASLGVGWGLTLQRAVNALSVEESAVESVVSFQGGVTRGVGATTFEIAARCAERLGAEPYFLAAPLYASTGAMREALLNQPTLNEVYRAAQNVDMALLSCGDLSHRSMLVSLGLIDARIDELEAAGAVGDVLGHLLNSAGEPVAHDLNERVVALSLADLEQVKHVVLASGGVHKAPIIRAALNRGVVTTLITDQETAQTLLGR